MCDRGSPRFVLYPFVLFVCFVVQEDDCEQWHAGGRSYLAPLMPSVLVGWSFARAYYFVFYVIGKYVDPSYRFAGLLSFVRYCARRRHKS